jgi:hypothetical protein
MSDTQKIRQITTAAGYGQEVRDQAFYLWYKLNKPEYAVVAKLMKEKLGVAPATQTLQVWKTEDNWEQHADTLDGVSDNAMDKEVIQQRAALIRKQAEVGNDLIKMGMDYLEKNGLDSSADAIRAIGKGAELQEKELGWAAIFAELANASQDDLDRKLKKFMTDDVVVEGTLVDAPTNEPEDKTESDE